MGLFSQQYTMKRKKFGMDQYREEFARKREIDAWAYKAKEGYIRTTRYAALLSVVEEIKGLLIELANAEDESALMKLRKEVKRRGFEISIARDYLMSKGS